MQVIIPHINTDLDALGAAVGAQVLYPKAVIVLPGPTSPLTAEFISLHRYNLRVRTVKDLNLPAVTQAIVVDTADPDRLGPLKAVVGRAEVHVYDHHPHDEGDLQGATEVRDMVGATCTLMAELLEESGVPLTPFQATAMLLGIYSDTGSLSLTGTTDRDARAAAYLLAQGANLRALARFVQGRLSPAQVRLLQQLQNGGRWITVNGARIWLLEAETPEYVGGLALVIHHLLEILPVPALFAAVRMADRVHLVGRSDVPWVDTAAAMSHFGGGGHRAASSAVVKGATASEVLQRLEAILPGMVDRPLMARDVMSAPVKAIGRDKPARDAERLMLRYGHTGLPVVDEQGRLSGIVSLRDVENARRHGLEHAPVKGIMMRQVVTVDPSMPLDQVQEIMVDRDIGRVPVIEGGQLLGIISRSDLLGQLYGGPAPRWHRPLHAGASAADPADASAVLARAVRSIPTQVRGLLRTAGLVAESLGASAYAVGGWVRDLLLGRPNLDLDIAVEGDGLTYARALSEALGGVLKEVPRFGTAHIFLQQPGLPPRVDVATARREFYEHAAALPVVEHADLREDLYRRDFSINAMAVRLTAEGPGGLVDFFGGLTDLQQQRIRILHSLSFVEDPTRLLRAVRFAHRYGFSLEEQTLECARTAIAEGYVERVSMERLRTELVLLLSEGRSGGALAQLDALGLLERLLPGVSLTREARERLDAADGLAERLPDLWAGASAAGVKLALLLQALEVPAGIGLVERLRLNREDAAAITQALGGWRAAIATLGATQVNPADAVKTLTGWAPVGLLLLALLGAEEAVARYWHEWRHIRLDISGADLIAAGIPAGPAVGRALARVLEDRLGGAAPDRETQLTLAIRYAHEEA